MSELYSFELELKLRKQLRGYYLWGVAMIFALLAATPAAVRFVSIPVAAVMTALTAGILIGVYCLIQQKILPLYRTHRLMHRLSRQEAEDFEGIFRGVSPVKTVSGKVMMHKLRIDEGTVVRKEAVFRELSIPAVFGVPKLEEGALLRGKAAEGVIVSLEPAFAGRIKPREGGYQRSSVVVTVLVLAAAVLWGSIYGSTNRITSENALTVAVCAPAHHEENAATLEQRMTTDEIRVIFSYTNTLEPETVAMYLATFGAMDADILVLNSEQFASVFENTGSPLDTGALEAALGFKPRFLADELGYDTALVLYDPAAPEYNANFPKLIDWIAVEKDVPLVVAIRSGSPHEADKLAHLALVQLLSFLSGK